MQSDDGRFVVSPRWPYKNVFVAEPAHAALSKAQQILDGHDIKLILTRGYENQGYMLKALHAVARILGATLFWVVFPTRRGEIREIFSPNGHDQNGHCVDVAIFYNEHRITLLPYGVFTPLYIMDHYRRLYERPIRDVCSVLEQVGFVIHRNQTESLQIHCELVSG